MPDLIVAAFLIHSVKDKTAMITFLTSKLSRTFTFLLVLLALLSCKKNISVGTTVPGNPVVVVKDTIPSDPATANTVGFFMDRWQTKTFTAPVVATGIDLPAGTATVTIHVNTGNVLTKIAPNYVGNNSNLWSGQLNQEAVLVNHLKNFQPRLLRGPGGSISDVFFFNANKNAPPADLPAELIKADGSKEAAGYWYGKNNESWTFSLDGYYDLLQKTNSTGVLTVNYGYARYGTSVNPVAAAAHLAADWVRYDNGRTKYWEIGNENFGDWEAGYRINTAINKDGQPEIITGALYGQHVKVFADSMRKAAAEVGASIRIGAVVFDSPPASWNTDAVKNWNAGVFSVAGNVPDYYSVHSYFTNYLENSSPETIFNTAATIPSTIRNYLVSGMQTSGTLVKPIAMTEWNLFSSGSKQNVSHIAGMHAVLAMSELIKTGYAAAIRWDLANGWDNGDDHGLFNNGSEPGVEKWNPRPSFFHMYYFQKYTGDRALASTVTGSADIVSFASSFSSGQKGVVIVNKGTDAKLVETKFQYFTPGTKFYYYVLTGGTDNAPFSRMVYVNGSGPANGIAGGPAATYTAIKMYETPAANGVKVNVPARSTVILVVDKR